MRLHRLALRAFGPFAGVEEVDFDALAASGLFLLHGPTGAGKTSVLDAVCFALYGGLPGARSGATRLRSDHAEEGVAPEVVCEFSVGPRRLEVTRSPAWERPKRRGGGTTTEQAKVLVRELVDGGWQPLTSRLDEAAHLLEGLLGMAQSQFTKLVLLPQGDFAAFLRADAETRRAMLEKLFDTDRFSDVQQWLRDRQNDARHELDEARTVTRELLARAGQAAARLPQAPADPSSAAARAAASARAPAGFAGFAGSGRSDGSDGSGEDAPDGPPPDPRATVAALLLRAGLAWEDATARRAATQAAASRARAAHETGATLARRRAEHARLCSTQQRLAAEAGAQRQRRDRLRSAERALGVAPVAPVLTQVEDRLGVARVELDARVGEASRDQAALTFDGSPLAEALQLRGVLLVDASVLAGMTDAVLATHAAALREQVGHVSALAREATALAPAAERVRHSEAAVAQARQALQEATTAAAALAPTLAAERERLAAARAVAAGLTAALRALTDAEAVVGAVAERGDLTAAQERDRPRLLQARERRDGLRERWLDCRERRLEQMAAELAESLDEGRSCPVCGSLEHPAPARPGPDRVTEAEEQQAREAYEGADAAHATLLETGRARAERLAAVDVVAGGLTAEQAAARRDLAAEAVAAARRADGGLAERERTIERLVTGEEQADGVIAAARSQLHDLETDLATRAAAVAELTARCDRARGEDRTLAARATRLTGAADRLEAVLAARREHADALRAAATTRGTALAAAREAGFPSLAAALAAVLPDDEREALESQLRAHDSELAAVTAQLGDPELAAAAGQPEPDVVQLRSAEVLAVGDDEACARQVAIAEHAVEELRVIEAELAQHLVLAGPLEQRQHTLTELSRCADGTGGENTRRMSLSAYVLAARLEQVAQAASQRLAQMSAGRYTLAHSDEPVRGQRRAGLGLHVVDSWTGRQRDTMTLSGGESFYTSLALALGLADVVSAEAGGTAIETLFVDEGFGSLDEETLEEVMDVLDGLRSGGRAVGLVSHVADLRHRIPAQIEVVKGQSGSHLTVASA